MILKSYIVLILLGFSLYEIILVSQSTASMAIQRKLTDFKFSMRDDFVDLENEVRYRGMHLAKFEKSSC